ncbi:MAG TPA: polysaccharide deacetylase family protein [Fimbriimonas sp.]|nr:polysaccharide deacetylase family protein [Fimbriimonas sp.]
MKAIGQRVPVIMYHDIIEERNKDSQWFDCTTAEFEEHMLYLEQNGIQPVSLDQLYAHLNKGEALPDKAVVLTFDDNYQGFYDRALPILRARSFPAAVFVHTGFVGNKDGLHPKMDWPTLKELAKDPLVTIGNHTITHPDDITLVSLEQQVKELNESKKELEQQLGKPCPYLAYPNGKNDAAVQELARAAGHTMAFSIDNGLAEESPSIMCVNRYVHTRFEKAFEDLENARLGGAAGLFSMNLKKGPVSYREGTWEGVKLGLITGGTPTTVMSQTREGVLDFVKRTQGAVAGVNGGFFAVADVSSDDNRMVGPLKAAAMPSVVPDEAKERWTKLRNRPVLMWGSSSFAIVPYQPEIMRTDACFKDYMPDLSDTFLAGVWLVHGGVARTREELDVFGASDIQDFRRRAFMGVTADGPLVLGAALDSYTSEQVARAAAAAGLWEAVLLDSGFSTSLIYGQSIKASGHSNKDHPSRPVPHAVVLLGELDPATASLGAPEPAPPTEDKPKPRRRRR